MKNIFKTMALASMALTVGLASCSKDDNTNGGINSDAKTVLFSFSQEGQAITRASGEHVADQSAVTINDAYIYFVGSSNNIIDYVQIVTTGAGAALPYDATAKTVGMDLAKVNGGTAITGISGSTEKVYVVANYPGGTYPTTGNVETLMKAVTVENQFDDTNNDGGVKKVTVYGGIGLTAVDAANNKYSAKVIIKPIAARIEVGRITGKQTLGAGIKSFDLKGIYIDNYYTTFAGTTLVANGTDVNNFTSGHANFKYTSLDKILSDYNSAALVAQDARTYVSKTPAAATTVWGYNLVAPEAATEMAKLVIRVENVVVTDGSNDDATTYAGVKFLTVRKFYKTDTANPSNPATLLPKLERGWVYRIVNLEFEETDLTSNPNRNAIDVQVEVSVLPWYANDVEYDFE